MKLDEPDHRALVLWAADYAERVPVYFEEMHPGDDRPRNAIEAGRAWARGGLGMGEAHDGGPDHPPQKVGGGGVGPGNSGFWRGLAERGYGTVVRR